MSQGSRRVLHFAVSGALLGGGLALGCASKDEPATNTRMIEDPEPDAEPKHVNPGPDEEPAAEEGGALEPVEEDHVNVAKQPEPDPEEVEPVHVNEGPEPEPEKPKEPEAKVNPGPEPKPEPEPKRVNTAKEPG